MKVRAALDAVAVLNLAGTLIGWLPAIAALLTIVYTTLRIWEMKTVQDWVRRG